MSRRTLLRRTRVGITGIAVASLLVACGDDDVDPGEAVDEVEEPDSPELDPERPAVDAPNDDIEDESPEADEENGS